MCFWLSLQHLSETLLILSKIQRDIVTNAHRYSNKVPVILVKSLMKLNFSRDFRKILKYQMSRNCVQWELSYSTGTDGRTDGDTHTTKLTVSFFFFAILRMHLKTGYLHQSTWFQSTSKYVIQIRSFKTGNTKSYNWTRSWTSSINLRLSQSTSSEIHIDVIPLLLSLFPSGLFPRRYLTKKKKVWIPCLSQYSNMPSPSWSLIRFHY